MAKADIISSTVVEVRGRHDYVRVWNRGGLAGVLVVLSGDGQAVAERLDDYARLQCRVAHLERLTGDQALTIARLAEPE